MREKKILALSGGPHEGGTTATMLERAVCAAKKAGFQVENINLYQQNIAYCKGCRACLTTKKCVINDDIHEIAERIKACDAVILAAPVYWANVPAAVKNLFDRLLGVAMEETKTFPKPLLKGKRYMLLTACNTAAPFSWIFGQSRGACRAAEEFFKTAGMKCAGKFVCAGTGGNQTPSKKLLRKLERAVERL